ncbi:MAG: AMP-binding protein, partial [Alphaproteobacteria bacterium]
MYRTIGAALDDAALMWGAREALVCPHQGVRWTWQELKARAEEMAAGLLALGLEPGDRVGIWSPNKAEWVLTQFATAYAGLVLVNINPAYRLAELEYALNKVGCKALVLADTFKSSDYVAMVRDLAPEIDKSQPEGLEAARLPHLRHVIVIADEAPPGFLPFARIATGGTDQARDRVQALKTELQPEDPINIQFTSGTTGSPKGATLTHHNILNNGYFVGEAQRFTEEDRLCIPVPLYH